MLKALQQLAHPEFSQHVALQNEFESFTYQALNTLVENCAGLIQINIQTHPEKKTNSLGLCFKSPSLHLIASLAVLKLGLSQLSIQAAGPLTPKKILAEACGLDLLLNDFELDLGITQLPLNLDFLKTKKNYLGSPVNEQGITDAKNIALIVSGSGTTGKAKLIHIDFDNLNALMERDLSARKILPGEKHFSLTPVEFYTAKRRNLACLINGACIVLRESFQTDGFDMIQKLQVDHLSIASSHAQDLTQKFHSRSGPVYPQLKTVFLGGSPVSERMRQDIRQHISKNLFIAYGTNEIGEVCIASPEMQKKYPNCLGQPLPSIEAQVIDQNGNMLGANQTGQLRLKTKGVFTNYGNTDNSAIKNLKEGWFYPNDFVYRTSDNVLIFQGRTDDAIIFNGVIIYPREIEQLLEKIDGITAAAAFAIDMEHNQIPAAVFTAEQPMNIQKISQYLREEMGWLQPRYINQISTMPRNDAGKILKREIKNVVLAQIRQQIKKV